MIRAGGVLLWLCGCVCMSSVWAEAAEAQVLARTTERQSLSSPQQSSEAVDLELRQALIQAVNLESLDFNDAYDAQVWLVSMSSRLEPFIKSEQERLQLLQLVRQEAALSGLQPEIVLAVIEIESRFDRYAVSRVGAQGMMQVMPFWKNEIGRPEDNLIDTPTNLRYGCTILKHYLDKEKGDLHRALARYNGSSPFGTYAQKVFDAFESRWRGGAL